MKKHLERIVMGWMLLVLLILLTELPIFREGRRFFFDASVDVTRSFEVWRNQSILKESNSSELRKVTYQVNGIEGSYPRIISGGTEKAIEQWNSIIKKDFDKILQIYSFQPFPVPTPSSSEGMPIHLNITYEIKNNTKELLSVFYLADFNSSFVAHPSNLVYTTLLDKNRSKRLRLGDIVNLSDEFVKEFRIWKPKASSEENEEMMKAAQDYIGSITDKDLLNGFRSADRIGSGNPWGIYSYLTKDNLGISIEVPHYAGDQIQYEVPLSQLKKYLKDGYGS